MTKPHSFQYGEPELGFEIPQSRWAQWFPRTDAAVIVAAHRTGQVSFPDTTLTYFVALVRATRGDETSWELGHLVYSWGEGWGNWRPIGTLQQEAARPVQAKATVHQHATGIWAIVFGVVNDPEIGRVRVETSAGAVEGDLEERYFFAVWKMANPGDRDYAVPRIEKLMGYDAEGRLAYEETQ